MLTLVAGATALFPSVLPTLLLAFIPIIQLLVVDHNYALAAFLIIVYLFVYLNIDGVVYAQGEGGSASGSDGTPCTVRGLHGLRIRTLTTFPSSHWNARTAWLAFMGVFLGFQAFDIKGVILGPLVVACLLGLMNIAEFVLRHEPDNGGAADGPRVEAGNGARVDGGAGVRANGGAGMSA